MTLNYGLEVTQDHWKWYHLKAWIRFSIRLQSLVTTAVGLSLAISEIFSVKEWPDFEIWVWGRSRLLKMARFDRPCMYFYYWLYGEKKPLGRWWPNVACGGRNHVCNILWLSVKECGCSERGNFAFSHWREVSPLQDTLPCDRMTVLSRLDSSIQSATDMLLLLKGG